MAVDVRNTPDTTSASLLDRMATASLAGAAYVLGTLGIVFYLLPSLWPWEGNTALMTRALVQLAAFLGLLVYGSSLLGPRTATGTRAGIFVSLLGFLFVLLLTRWASLWIEHWSYDLGVFGRMTGAALTGVVGVGLLAIGARLFMKPWTERFLAALEEQGWFSVRPYKTLQGIRVRRGTIFGILLLFGSGIWTLMAHGTLRRGAPDWQLDVPFTGRVTIESKGDVPAEKLNEASPGWETRLADHTLVIDRYTLQEINQSVDPAKFAKIFEPGASELRTNEIVPRDKFNSVVREFKDPKDAPAEAPLQPAGGPLSFSRLTLLPSVQFTVPLLMLAVGLWLAWRVVNVPAFADFLIATEAEMNKVSWTTQRRLIQDTIVVLVTVVLMAFYLFSMDVVWKSVLSWKYIGVLKISTEEQREAAQPPEDRPW